MGTPHGGKLNDIDKSSIRDRLSSRPASGKAVVRLVAALEYKHGLSPAQIEDKYGWPASTVYHWLDYLTERGIDEGVSDLPRSGRPWKLSTQQRAELHNTLQQSPEAAGYQTTEWSPQLLQRHVKEMYGVEYSDRHVARLLSKD